MTSDPLPHSLVVVGTDLYYATQTGTGVNQSAIVRVPIAGGTAPVPLISGVSGGVQAIAISGGFIYYSSTSAIARIPLAGGPSQPVASLGGTTLGVDGSDVFFTTYAGTGVSKAPVIGGTVTPLISAASGASGLGVSSTFIYFSAMGGGVPASGLFRFAR